MYKICFNIYSNLLLFCIVDNIRHFFFVQIFFIKNFIILSNRYLDVFCALFLLSCVMSITQRLVINVSTDGFSTCTLYGYVFIDHRNKR